MNCHESTDYPFEAFRPVFWHPARQQEHEEEGIYSVRRDHGIRGRLCFHNPRDEINSGRLIPERVLVEYRIGRNRYDLFTVADLFAMPYAFEEKASGNIMGDAAERIARRVTKYFLKHYSRQGHTGGIFDKRFNPAQRDNFIVANTHNFVLKIQKYPNLVILKKTGSGKYGYENIKELDGLFDYRYQGRRHILVLESKLEKIRINCRDLVSNLFTPLREFFPETCFSYILFSDRHSLFRPTSRHRQLRAGLIDICRTLEKHAVGTLFFTFNENHSDFEKVRSHLITQYRSVASLQRVLHGTMLISNREIVLFDQGETPHIKLVRDWKSGLWREVKLTHKHRR